MTARTFDPRRLDVAAFANEAATLDGRWPVSQLHRLAEATVADGAPSGDVTWHARGERRALRGGGAEVWLYLNISTCVSLECQRCLKPVAVSVGVERRFLFVSDEDAAAQLDADSDDDVLALSRAFDLRELVEDELLLALPLVPRHEVCPDPLTIATDGVQLEVEPSPFAALAAIKRGGTLN